MPASRVGSTLYQGQNKTTGTTLDITGASTTVAVGDTVFVGAVFDGTGISPTLALNSGTATLGAFTSLFGQASSGNVTTAFIWRAEVTGAGTVVTIRITHPSLVARTGEAALFRDVPTGASATANGQTGSASLTMATFINLGVLAHTFGIWYVGWEGLSGDMTINSPSSLNMDVVSPAPTALGTTGGGATSNVAGFLDWVLDQSTDTAASPSNNTGTVVTARAGSYVGAFYQPAAAVPIDVIMAAPRPGGRLRR